MAYKIASDKAQARARRITNYNLPAGFEELSPEEQRENLVAILKQVHEDVKNERNKWRRRELGLLQFEIQNKIRAIRPKAKTPGASRFFIEAARKVLTSAQFHLVMSEASRMAGSKSFDDHYAITKDKP